MPFQSEKQRRYLWANEPEIARDWTDTYGSGIAKALGGRIPFAEAGSTGKTSIPEWNLAILKTALETATSDEERAEIQSQIDTVEGDIGTGADTLLGSGEAPTEGFWGKLSEMLGMSQAEGAEPTEEERAAIERTGGVEDVRDPLVYDEEKGYDVRDLQAHGLAGIYPHAWDNKPTLEGDPFYKDGEFQTFKQPTRNWDPADYPFKGPVQSGYETLGYNESGNPLQDFRGNVRSTSGVRQLYKTPRTIADQNRVLGRTFTDADTGSNWLANLKKYTMPAYNFARGNIGAGLMGVMNPLAGLAMFAGGKNLKDSRFYKPATQGAYGYNPAQLNQMNALGGYYSEPARQQRRTESRIENLLARKAAGKSYSQKNLDALTGNQVPVSTVSTKPTRPRGPVGPPPGGGPHGGGGGSGSGGGGMGKGKDPGGGAAGSPFNRGGLAGLWQR